MGSVLPEGAAVGGYRIDAAVGNGEGLAEGFGDGRTVGMDRMTPVVAGERVGHAAGSADGLGIGSADGVSVEGRAVG